MECLKDQSFNLHGISPWTSVCATPTESIFLYLSVKPGSGWHIILPCIMWQHTVAELWVVGRLWSVHWTKLFPETGRSPKVPPPSQLKLLHKVLTLQIFLVLEFIRPSHTRSPNVTSVGRMETLSWQEVRPRDSAIPPGLDSDPDTGATSGQAPLPFHTSQFSVLWFPLMF